MVEVAADTGADIGTAAAAAAVAVVEVGAGTGTAVAAVAAAGTGTAVVVEVGAGTGTVIVEVAAAGTGAAVVVEMGAGTGTVAAAAAGTGAAVAAENVELSNGTAPMVATSVTKSSCLHSGQKARPFLAFFHCVQQSVQTLWQQPNTVAFSSSRGSKQMGHSPD